VNSLAQPPDALLLEQLTDQERAHSVVYLDEQVRAPGMASLGGTETRQEHPYYVAFVDQKPGANWMHPCRYLVIDSTTGKMTSLESDRPPVFGILPQTWRVVWRSPRIEDWRLLPISRPPS